MTQRFWFILVAAQLAGLAAIVGRDALMMSPGAPHQAARDERRNPFMLADVRTPVPEAAPVVIEFRAAYCISTGPTLLCTLGRDIDPARDKA